MKTPSICFLLLLPMLSACAGVPFPEHTPFESASQQDFLHARLSEVQSTPHFVERVTLEMRGEESVLTLYADGVAPGELRLAAVSDLGATIFSVEWLSGELEVLHASEALPPSFLEEFVADHVIALLTPPAKGCRLVRVVDGATALRYELFGEEALAFVGEGEGVLQLERGRDGNHRTTIELGASQGLETIELEAVDGSYRASIQIAPWQ